MDNMYGLLLKFVFGVVLLLFSTHTFVKLAVKISRIVRISPLIIGTTIVALGTSLPELAVSTIASVKHDSGLAIGNIIGSNIANILMVLPVGILIGKLRIGTNKTQQIALLTLGVTILYILLHIIQFPPLLSGVVLIAIALLITAGEYELGLFGRDHEDARRLKNHKREKLFGREVISFILLIIGIIVGGVFIVSSVESMSVITGISTTVFGLSLTAIVTSLPELLTTIFSQEENQGKITIGNIIGSNIYNLLFIGGLIMIFSPISQLFFRDWLMLVAATVCFVLILRYYSGKLVPKRIGVSLLLLFLVYLFVLSKY